MSMAICDNALRHAIVSASLSANKWYVRCGVIKLQPLAPCNSGYLCVAHQQHERQVRHTRTSTRRTAYSSDSENEKKEHARDI
jgi:hypothetical protein